MFTVCSVGAAAPVGVWFRAFRLSNAVGLVALVVQAPKRLQASAAKMPTVLLGACALPRKGRAVDCRC